MGAVAPDEPVLVAGLPGGAQGLAEILDRLEPTGPERGLRQRSDKALGAAVAVGARTTAGEIGPARKRISR